MIVRRPEPVVSDGQPRRADEDLARHTVAALERLDPDPDARERPPDAYAVPDPDLVELGQLDVRHREDLRHPVRRVQLGSRSELRERVQDTSRYRCSRREHEPQRSERFTALGRQLFLRGEYAVEGSGSSEEDRRVDRGAGVGERDGTERRRLGDVAVGNCNRDPEGRAVEGERCERRDETIVRADRVTGAHRIELRGHLATAVDDTLGRPGRARREDDRRRRIGIDDAVGHEDRELRTATTERGDVESARGRNPAECTRDAERLPGTEQPPRLRTA